MFKIYNVYCKGKYIDMVKALTPDQACKMCYMRYGSASKYSGFGLQNFKAVEV